MKLKDLTENQAVQTTEENHEAFLKLLDKQGFRWRLGASYMKKSYSNEYKENIAFMVKKGTYIDIPSEVKYEIIPASKFLKPTKRELLERIEYLENLVNVPYESKRSTPSPGDLCAFADDEMKFDKNSFRVGKLAEINNSGYPYNPEDGSKYKYARKVEIKFI